ncbi:BfmA/BtgA family mobilization protein [uncultured Marixanthomonas sp.]|uniref:BfmA/BtgA family mobilization protein n=1 Tax=uncultured Marixanthomonas sp. TaxID=757245 RepID=UPI0030D89A60|tara:strand:- start:304137 stop:304478 length:342 start_codon:yes stop_codon:yes gene_type:complete
MSSRFSRVSFHTDTVERFKQYAIENDVNYTETLEAMLDFFEKHSIDPFVPFDNSIHSLKLLIDKRMDAVVAILRQIEREQTKPTKEMLDRLFEKQSESKPMYREKKSFGRDTQ